MTAWRVLHPPARIHLDVKRVSLRKARLDKGTAARARDAVDGKQDVSCTEACGAGSAPFLLLLLHSPCSWIIHLPNGGHHYSPPSSAGAARAERTEEGRGEGRRRSLLLLERAPHRPSFPSARYPNAHSSSHKRGRAPAQGIPAQRAAGALRPDRVGGELEADALGAEEVTAHVQPD